MGLVTIMQCAGRQADDSLAILMNCFMSLALMSDRVSLTTIVTTQYISSLGIYMYVMSYCIIKHSKIRTTTIYSETCLYMYVSRSPSKILPG